MSREEFTILLEKYQDGTCTDKERELVEYWFALYEKEEHADTEPDLSGVADRMLLRMEERAGVNFEKTTPVFPLRITLFKWIGVAASVLLVSWFVFDSRFLNTSFDNSFADGSWSEQRNDTNSPMSIVLEDSSTVALAPNSVLRFPKHFESAQRVVLLKGDGFFNIRKNPEKPFLVYSEQLITRVLGTSFYVKSSPDRRSARVEVVTGLVSVYSRSEEKGKTVQQMLVRPNQTASFDADAKALTAGLVESPRLLDPTVSFQFRNTPLSQVTKNIADAWGVQVTATNNGMLNCPLTANLTGQPLFIQLDIICAALGAKYKVTGNYIQITGQGCKNVNASAGRN